MENSPQQFLTPEMIEALRNGANIDELLGHDDEEDISTKTFEKRAQDINVELFENDSYTFTNFKLDTQSTHILFKKSVIAKFVACVALVGNDFIVKEIDNNSQRIIYSVWSSKEMKNALDYVIEAQITRRERDQTNEKAKASHRKQICDDKTIHINASKLLFNDSQIRQVMKKYQSVGMVPADENCFGLFRPPLRWLWIDKRVKYNRQMAIDFIEFIASRIKNPEAWYDQLNTHKYQLINPTKKAVRFYINFEKGGGTGKSFSSIGISKMYGTYQQVNVEPKAMKDTFNNWIQDTKYIAFEEAENNNYTDKDVNTFVKRWTGLDMSVRAMYKSYTKGKNYAIATMSANDPGLYGLTRSDPATKRRLVVAMFKANNLSKAEWDAKKKWLDDPSFGYSLYKYMYEEYELPETYNPDEYVNSYDVWQELGSMKKNPVETFNELLQMNDEEFHDRFKVNYKIVKFYKGARTEYFYIMYADAMEEFKKHLALNNNKLVAGETFKAGMEDLGWEFDKQKKMNGKQNAVFFRKDFENVPDTEEEENEITDEAI